MLLGSNSLLKIADLGVAGVLQATCVRVQASGSTGCQRGAVERVFLELQVSVALLMLYNR